MGLPLRWALCRVDLPREACCVEWGRQLGENLYVKACWDRAQGSTHLAHCLVSLISALR